MKLLSGKFLRYCILVLLCTAAFHVRASIIDGTIDPANHTAQVCELTVCTVTPTSSVNFGYFTDPASNPATTNVHVLDTELTGFIWGESFGWTVLNCADTTSGCSATNGNFKVTNDYNGNLSGYAWGDTGGWISFWCNNDPLTEQCASNGNFRVTINSSGEFSGYAWSQNFGYIKFDCTLGSDYCVKTDWRPRNARPACSDGIDNDSDGLIDSGDSGCLNNGSYDPTDSQEFISSGGGGGGSTGPTPIPPSGPGTPPVIPGGTVTPPISTPPGGTTPGDNNPPPTQGDPTDTIPGDTPGSGDPGENGDTNTGNGETIDTRIIDAIPLLSPEARRTLIDILSAIKEFLSTRIGDLIARTITLVGALAGIVGIIATGIFANPLTFSEIFLIPFRLWSLLLAAFGLKKRNRPWGTVYDSVTKQPLDPAYVILQDLEGNEVATSITDIDGRYGFLVPPGTYRMVAHKTNYEFPSKNLLGKARDELYGDLYFNDIITVVEGGVITKNIPLDPLHFDWNEFAKRDQNLMKFYSRRDVFLVRLANILFWLGFIVTIIAVIVTPRTYNIITLAVYVLLFILKHTILKPRPFGTVTYPDGTPLSFAIMRIYQNGTDHEIAHKVTDQTGRYYALIPNGTYYVKIDKKNPDASYTPVYTSLPIEVTKGYINKAFKL